MHSVVPILGHHALQTPPLLAERICSIIKKLGHEPTFVDEGSISIIHNADPLRTRVPFSVTVKDSLPPEVIADWLTPIRFTFPSANHIVDSPAFIPIALVSRSNELILHGNLLDPDLVRRTMQFAFKRLSDTNLELQAICDCLGVTKTKLESEFAKCGMRGAWKAIRRLRVDVASDLLTETRRPIYEIALSVGYSDLSSFDTSFHAVRGMSPRQFRQNDNFSTQSGKRLTHIHNASIQIVN